MTNVVAVCALVVAAVAFVWWMERRNNRPIEHNTITGRGGRS